MGFGILALAVPLWPELAPERRLGLLLAGTALAESFHGFRRADRRGRRAAWFGGAITFAMSLLLWNAPALAGKSVVVFVAGWFLLDAVRHAIAAVRDRGRGLDTRAPLLASGGNLAVVGLIVLSGDRGVLWTLAIASALRMFGVSAQVATAPVFAARDAGDAAVRDLGLGDFPELRALGDRIEDEEEGRKSVDWFWVGTFLVTLFAIHVGRMGLDRSTFGIVSPGFAVLGDMTVALAIGLGLVIPIRVVVRALSRPLERRAWAWCLAEPHPGEATRRGKAGRWCVRCWLVDRLRFAVRIRQARYSMRAALARGLQIGLPVAAILAATTPMWGMSWYFDTENYATGIWNSWAEARTDVWREAMIRALEEAEEGEGRTPPDFSLAPPGISPGEDFGFLVIGDPGEGDASQLVLKDSLLSAAGQPGTKFVVISSDVVYPTGEMKDYEANFWLPFKGVTKPVYAIPGNHDWYDALDGFAATFLDPRAARTMMRGRAEADGALGRRSEARIERALREAARLRGEYGVPTGFQQGPFFQIQTDRFALIAVDTGVRKRVDPAQGAWFRAALEAARGKFTFVILGHPLYAVGQYRADDREDFQSIHDLLRRHDVRVVMAGDTHDFEYYAEIRDAAGMDSARTLHHFVNGGGGAFLTMGAQLARPGTMPVKDWAFYPATAPLVAKVEAKNSWWKKPLWWWTREHQAWPSAPEWVSAAFDYNVAPFFQSFVEVRVELSANRVRVLPWGVHGRLRWKDLQASDGLRPRGAGLEDPVEWVFRL
ncbi:MAG: metallophosphoesterase [Limisphaerales bacterium]